MFINHNQFYTTKYTKCPSHIKNHKYLINCIEDIFYKELINVKNALFPNQTCYKPFVYILSLLHIFSLLFSIIGLFMNPKYLIYYCYFILFILISLIVHKQNCYLTLIKTYYSKSKLHPIHLKGTTANIILLILIIVGLIGYLYPNYSLYYISKDILDYIYNHSKLISFSAIILFLVTFLFYFIMNIYLTIQHKNNNNHR